MMLSEKINQLLAEIKNTTFTSKEELEQFRLSYLSKKGILNDLFSEMNACSTDQKKVLGKQLNELKTASEEKFSAGKSLFEQELSSKPSGTDLSRPVHNMLGARHPLSIVQNQMISIFSKIGFTLADGPEIEDDWHNFSALNFPEEHPARDMQDTFFIAKDPDLALRTHTSSVQVRVMENSKPPIRTLLPGRVFRNEAISARAHCQFHQIEGLYIDENVSFADLKQTLLYFSKEMFGENTQIRLRPSYFPFTEPSAEMDISCNICMGKGCNICKYSGWIEIGGCGMVDPHVLDNCKIDSTKYTGFAFGFGIERMAMGKFKVNDLRVFFENDVRFLKQFEGTL
jgi:phenylalanyl-tRNA synthetase alpha chain